MVLNAHFISPMHGTLQLSLYTAIVMVLSILLSVCSSSIGMLGAIVWIWIKGVPTSRV